MDDHYDAFSNTAVFRTQLWGFRREEVLEYIEKISAANAEKARALGETIDKLRAELSRVQGDSKRLASAADHTCKELEAQKKKAETAIQENALLKKKMEQQKLSAAQLKQELERLRFENDVLKKDNRALHKEIERLDSELNRRDSELREVNDTIQKVDVAMKRRMNRLKDAENQTQRQAQAVIQQAQRQAQDMLREAQTHAQAIQSQAQQNAQERLRQADHDARHIHDQAYRDAAQTKQRLMASVDEISESIRLLKKQLEQVDEQVERASTGLGSVSAAAPNASFETKKKWDAYPATHKEEQTAWHKPMAQPFAPFEQGVPHTPPYGETSGNAVPFPPKPPESQPTEENAYIPRPTPVAPGASFSQPYEPGKQETAAPQPTVNPLPVQSLEDTPDIIPYLSPIPQAPVVRPSEKQREESPAKDLLKSLHAMLEEMQDE